MKHWQWLALLPLLLFCILLIFINSFNPGQAGPVGILLVFVLIYAISLNLCFLLVFMGPKLLKLLGLSKKANSLSGKKAYYIASVAAALPLLLITIQAANNLKFLDVILVIIFLGLTVFYIQRRV